MILKAICNIKINFLQRERGNSFMYQLMIDDELKPKHTCFFLKCLGFLAHTLNS